MSRALAARCASEADTVALGERIGLRLACGDLLSVSGPLGAGKTVLVRGIATGAGADPIAVRSPTFVLHHVYSGERVMLHHLDVFRLGAGADLRLLDVEGLLETGAVVVEWGDLADLRGFAPVHVTLSVEGDNARIVTLLGDAGADIAGAWTAAVP